MKKEIIFPIGYEIEKADSKMMKVKRTSGTFKRIYKSGKAFTDMPEEKQIKYVKACVYHGAKNLDTMRKKNAEKNGYIFSFINNAKKSFVTFVNEHKDDIMQEAFLNCLANTETENAKNPLLLYLTIECTKAINKYYYDNSKPKDNIEDVEYRLPTFDNPETKAIAECTKQEIFAYLPKAKRANIIMYLDLKDYGYQLQEIAEIMNVSEKTLCEYKFEYACALAIVKAENKEYETARAILDTVKATKAQKAKERAEKWIADIVKGIYKENSENNKAVNKWLSLSYVERINLYTKDKKAFDRIAKLAFK